MPEDGLFPTLIQWPGALNEDGPAPNMADLGCTLETLTLFQKGSEHLRAALKSIGADGLADVEDGRPRLEARIVCPNGLVTLD